MEHKDKNVVVIGAGPAGLASSYELGKHKIPTKCLEATSEIGGLSRTKEYSGYLFDIGGHGFYSNNEEVNTLWNEVLKEDLKSTKNKYGLYHKNRVFVLPPELINTAKGFGILECILITCSFTRSLIFPLSDVSNMEIWWINQYGKRFYKYFFKPYNEKVWGIPSDQMMQNMNEWRSTNPFFTLLKGIIKKMFTAKPKKVNSIDSIGYPRFGAGQMYREMAHKAREKGVEIIPNNDVICLTRDKDEITEVISETPEGKISYYPSHVISSMPLVELLKIITPKVSDTALTAASKLIYRSLICVNLIIDSKKPIPYTHLYISEPSVKMVRLECFENWMETMVPDKSKSSLTCEYFINEGEGFWLDSDDELIALAANELKTMNILDPEKIIDGFVIRVPKAYPVLDINYSTNIEKIYVELGKINNLDIIGRNGMHKYSNMEDTILSGLKSAREIIKKDIENNGENQLAKNHK